MEKKKINDKSKDKSKGRGPLEIIYGFGFIGAAVYYLSQANSFLTGVLGFLKALVWPVFLVIEFFKYLGI